MGTGDHMGDTLGAVGPRRAAAARRALLWLCRHRAMDTEVTGGSEMMRAEVFGREDVG